MKKIFFTIYRFEQKLTKWNCEKNMVFNRLV